MKKELLIATHNPAKLNEILLASQPLIKKEIRMLSLNDLHISDEPVETGKTFCENAVLKAMYYFKLSGIPTLSDDGGVTIDYLHGEPGIKSRRWLGYDAPDEPLIHHTLSQLKKVPDEKRGAQLRICMCFTKNGKTSISVEETIHGSIAHSPSSKRITGYPFRSLFIVSRFNRYYDELTEEEHLEINHRRKALSQLLPQIETELLK